MIDWNPQLDRISFQTKGACKDDHAISNQAVLWFVKVTRVPFTNAFLPKVTENLKGGKETCKPRESSSFAREFIVLRLLASPPSSYWAPTWERASGRFPSGERAATLVRSRSAAREPHGAQRKKPKNRQRAARDGWQERERDEGRFTRRGTVETRGSGTEEGLGSMGGKEEGGIRGEDSTAGEWDRWRRRKKGASSEWIRYALEIVRNARCVRWLLSSLTRESLTNARFLFLSLSLPFSRSSSTGRVEFFFTAIAARRSPGRHLPRNSERYASRSHGSAVFPHKVHGFAARRDPIGSVKDTRRITQPG